MERVLLATNESREEGRDLEHELDEQDLGFAYWDPAEDEGSEDFGGAEDEDIGDTDGMYELLEEQDRYMYRHTTQSRTRGVMGLLVL